MRSVGERWRELQRVHLRTAAILFLLILLMGAIDSHMIVEINVVGIRISKDNATLSVLLLLSSILMFFVCTVSLISDSYAAVIWTYSEAKKDPRIASYYAMQFGWSLKSTFDGLSNIRYLLSAKLTVLSAVLFLLSSLVVAVLIAELVQFILFVSTILTVYDSWKLSNNINLPIVVIAICAALFNACAFILSLPLPYYDFSNIEKLEQLEKSDPDEAARVRDRIIKVRESRERRNLLILETITIMIAIVITHVLWPGSGHLSGYMILIPMIYSPIVLYFINKPILERYEAHTIAALAKYREANELIQQYIKCKKRILFMRLVFAAISGVLAFSLFEWAIMDAIGKSPN